MLYKALKECKYGKDLKKRIESLIDIKDSINLNNLSLKWDNKVLLENVNLKIKSGTINIIVHQRNKFNCVDTQ